MSTPPAPPEPGAIACPRCGAPVARDQDWCLTCGAAARTRLAPAPNWKLPLATIGAVVAACLVALALAFVALTDDPDPGTGATGATGPTAVTPPAVTPPPAPTGPSGPTGATSPQDDPTGDPG